MKIETNREIYYINKKNIIYINIYEDTAGIKTIEIRLRDHQNIIIDEQETGINGMKKLINIIDTNKI